MHARCFNKNNPGYKDYGGRGITVCAEWQGREGFANFLLYMGRKPDPKLTVERMENDGNYEPGNVCWASPSWQRRNQRRSKRNQTARRQACAVLQI